MLEREFPALIQNTNDDEDLNGLIRPPNYQVFQGAELSSAAAYSSLPHAGDVHGDGIDDPRIFGGGPSAANPNGFFNSTSSGSSDNSILSEEPMAGDMQFPPTPSAP